MVALKLATSLDGRIATRAGESRWITGEEARAFGHRLRATHDAIAVGSGTVLADDPELTCRIPGLEHRSPVRLVFDRRGRTPLPAQVLYQDPADLDHRRAGRQLLRTRRNSLKSLRTTELADGPGEARRGSA